MRLFIVFTATLSAAFARPCFAADLGSKPNIVVILCDDLGIGDVHAFNPRRGKIPTPSIDRMAAQGMMFTDAHTSSAVCTPSRYSILTGRYCWRSRLQAGVLGGFSEPLLARDRRTVAEFLQHQGYMRALASGIWDSALGPSVMPRRWLTGRCSTASIISLGFRRRWTCPPSRGSRTTGFPKRRR